MYREIACNWGAIDALAIMSLRLKQVIHAKCSRQSCPANSNKFVEIVFNPRPAVFISMLCLGLFNAEAPKTHAAVGVHAVCVLIEQPQMWLIKVNKSNEGFRVSRDMSLAF